MTVLKERETVVLLHGIGHTRWNMRGAEHAFKRAGYNVINLSYPSLRDDLKTLGTFVHDTLRLKDAWNNANKVHFVTHSMGGLVLRYYLASHGDSLPPGKAGRIVMIAPPNGGSEIADFLHRLPLYRWIFGPAGQELCTNERGDRTAPKLFETGIIAGSLSWLYPVANLIMPDGSASHDGRVSIERTKLDGMKDHITLPASHGLISWKRATHRQALHFIRNGAFDHGR